MIILSVENCYNKCKIQKCLQSKGLKSKFPECTGLYARTVFHLVFLIHHVSVLAYFLRLNFRNLSVQYNEPKLLEGELFGYRYLTFWNFGLQILYLFCATLRDYLQITGLDDGDFGKHLRNSMTVMFSAVIFPGTLSICSTFWAIASVNRELIIHHCFRVVLSDSLNHSLHTLVIFFVLGEFLQQKHFIVESLDRRKNLIWAIMCPVFYSFVLLETYWESGKWMYPVLDDMSWPQRSLLVTLSCILYVIYYKLYEALVFFMWYRRFKRIV